MREDKYFQMLANAIIVQAAKDFRAAYKAYKRKSSNKWAESEVRELTKFFCSDYFDVLTNVDGPSILHRMMRDIDEGESKRTMRASHRC